MDEISLMIQSVGFPITISLALSWYVWKVNQDTRADFLSREDKLLESNNKMSEALSKSADAIREATAQHDLIIERLSQVEVKVNIIDENVTKLL